MDEQHNAATVKPAARLEFARRLRELRIPKGFRTARSLARALSIDENRYTRYERAEVEPDLELLMRICEILGVTPNDLLGSDSPAQPGAVAMASGLAEILPPFSRQTSEPTPGPASDIAVQSIGWALCGLIAHIRLAHTARQPGAAAGDNATPPLAYLQMVTDLQQELDQQPFDFIRQIVRDPAMAEASGEAAREAHDLIVRLTEAMARKA